MVAMFAHTIPVSAESAAAPQNLTALLEQAPASAAVFALHFGENREPYLSHTTDLRRRLRRMLAPGGAPSKRLNLLPHVRAISWTSIGSPFESGLLLYRACCSVFGPQTARRRLRLRSPSFLRLSAANPFPRLYVTNKLVRRSANPTFGPFPSRFAAERYLDLVLDLFQLRRCYEDLAPYPEHPGCVYGEMKKCLAPCQLGCTPARYADESAAVFAFLHSRGTSLLSSLDRERAAASEALEFERAAAIHTRYGKVKEVAAEMPEAVRLLSELAAVIVQPSAEEGHISLFALRDGRLSGRAQFSTLGMRLHNEHSGSSSLFSHPVAIAPVPLEPAPATAVLPADTLEDRLATALQTIESSISSPVSTEEMGDHLALFTRGCYRPHARRIGEVVFSDPGSSTFPQKPLLRAISRVARLAITSPAALSTAPAGDRPELAPAPGR